MPFLPWDSFDFETAMSPEEILTTLKARVEPKKVFRFSSEGAADFEGTVAEDGFTINRIIRYHNGFLPIVTGKFRQGKAGTIIAIEMRLHRFAAAYMSVWFGGLGAGAVLMLCKGEGTQLVVGLLGVAVMITLGLLLMNWPFWYEAKKQKAMLLEMFGVRYR